jgi:acyl-CoA dehydrogenase family protein 9
MTDKRELQPQNTTSVVKSLFRGNLEEINLFPYPSISDAEKETLGLVIESIDKFLSGKQEQFREFDKKGEQPQSYLDSLKELGLFGLIIPEEYGGLGLSNSGYSRVLQQVTKYDGSTSLTVGAHCSIGMKGLLLFGNKAQKEKYLPKLASGEMIAAFCLTEPGSGSDAASIKTTAVKQPDGSWILNGEKLWITNGPIADFFTVFARTDSEGGKISGFIVERGPGLTHGNKEDKMGIRASATSTVVFQNMKIPAENLLGEEGKGFKVAMAILNNGRTGLGGGCVGAMKKVIAAGTKQAKERKQFGKSISEYQLVKEKLAQAAVQAYATESVVGMVGHYIDSGVDDCSVEAAISKIFATESLWSVGNEMLQIAGGNGFMKEYPYEMVVRDSRINMIFEGTNEILRLYISLSCLNELGSYLKDVASSVAGVFKDPIKGFGVFKEYAEKKVSENTALGRDRITSAHQVLAKECEIIEDYIAAFSNAAEKIVRTYKKEIVGNQLISKRIADCAIDLFVSLCVISRVTSSINQNGEQKCQDEIAIAQLFINQAKRRINQNLRRVEKNEDTTLMQLADSVLQNDGLRFDSI